MQTDEMLLRVARVTRALRWKTVYVGGATTHLLLTDPLAPAVTPTKDVDLLVDIRSPVEFSIQLRDELLALGAREDTSEGAPLCRWKFDEVTIDVMSPNEQILGFSNRWYETALENCQPLTVRGTELYVIDAVTFVATKIEAFLGRGRGDFLASKDVEDIIAVIDGRPELSAELSKRDETLRQYVSLHLKQWIDEQAFRYAVEGYLQADAERIPLVFERVHSLINA